jgi:hypothetical protein
MTPGTGQMMVPGRCSRQRVSRIGGANPLLGRLKQSSAVSVLEGAGQAVPHEVFRQIAAWPDCRITLARELEALERPDLFPNDFHEPAESG